jgi:hypothetical protein
VDLRYWVAEGVRDGLMLLGGYESMLAHRGLAITTEQSFRFAWLLSLGAGDAGLSEDPEFRSALLAYVERGTRLAGTTHSPGPRSSSTRPCRAGAGARRPLRAVGPARSRRLPVSRALTYPDASLDARAKQRRLTKPHSGYSSFRQERGSSGCGLGVLSSSMLKNGTTNGSGACTV